MQPFRQYPLFEWLTATMMTGIALCVVITPKTIEMGAFRYMLDAGFTPFMAFLFFIGAGGLRMLALIANGRLRYGTHCRAAGALVGAFMWFHMAYALIQLTEITGTLSVGIPVYFVLMIGEVISCYRVALHAHHPGPIHNRAGGHDAPRSQRIG